MAGAVNTTVRKSWARRAGFALAALLATGLLAACSDTDAPPAQPGDGALRTVAAPGGTNPGTSASAGANIVGTWAFSTVTWTKTGQPSRTDAESGQLVLNRDGSFSMESRCPACGTGTYRTAGDRLTFTYTAGSGTPPQVYQYAVQQMPKDGVNRPALLLVRTNPDGWTGTHILYQ